MKNGLTVSANAQEVNFRAIRGGAIAPQLLYRSSHPIQQNRQEPVIALLAASTRIATVINLADTDHTLTGKAFFAPWYNRLLQSGRVIALGMDFSHTGDNFQKKLKKALRFIISTDGPWLIHCHAGIDRTGFVSMILEAFMGATLDEIIADYLLSFNSIFDSSINAPSHKADALVAMKLLSVISGAVAVTDANVQGLAEDYLKNIIRLSRGEIDALKLKLSGGLPQIDRSREILLN